MKKITLLALLFLFSEYIKAQTKEIDSTKQVILNTKNDSVKAEALADLSWLTKYSDPAKALEYGWQSIALCDAHQYEELKAHACNSIGITYWSSGNYDSARIYIEKTGALYKKYKNTRGEALTYSNLGLIFQNQGNYEKSLEYGLLGLRIIETLNDKSMTASAYLNIGNVYFLKEEYQTAKSYYFKSLALKRVASEKTMGKNIQKTLGNIANAYQKLKMPDSAFHYFKEAIPYAIEAADLKNLCLAYNEIGYTFSGQKQYDSALYYYDKALTIYNERKFVNDYDLATLYQSMSHTYMDKGDLRRAVQFGVQSLDLAGRIKSLNKLKDSYELMAIVYEKTGQAEKALDAHKMFVVYKDSLITSEKNKQIAELQTKYETEKKNQQISILNKDNELKTSSLERNYLFIGALLTTLALLILLFYLWRYRTIQKQKAIIQEQKIRLREAQINAVVESQERERKRFASDLHDGMGQLVSALQMNIQSIKQGSDLEKATIQVENSEQLLNEIQGEIRNIAFNLMPPVLVKEGLVPAVAELVRRLNQSGSKKVMLSTHDVPDRFPQVVEISIYRIIQELLSNITKHSKATEIVVSFTGFKEELVLTIEDNGQGFDLNTFQNSAHGNGWQTLQTRINLVRGQIEFDTVEGRQNNTVIIHIPVVATQNSQYEPEFQNT